ncbi:hypothetical protein L226DRAFT_40372 [Lentinus tigrinus ALCF2SS1-7]|uniref:uncharacterized protein n=1 Tax=Lentinus tigrinus ALCF2SS1-7 TaxID=1328758 RepID=UPI0011661F0F|nr:hypothetical protein L226DRAFT_40372 [Lentinus tigrinus ALCF2SS1-7]
MRRARRYRQTTPTTASPGKMGRSRWTNATATILLVKVSSQVHVKEMLMGSQNRMNDLGLFDIRTPFWQSICRPGSASRRRSPGDSCGLGSRKANRAKLGGSVLRPRRPVPPHVVPQFADLSVWDIRRAGRARFRGCVHPPASSLDKAFANTYVSTICIEAAGDGCHASGV